MHQSMTDEDPCLCTALRQAAHDVSRLYDEALAPSGLRVTMYRLLKRVALAEEPTISDLARIVSLDRSTLGRNLRVLERQGLIEIAPGRDERSRTIRPTDLGHSRLEMAEPMWRGAQARLGGRLGADRVRLVELLASARDEAA